MSTLRTTRLDGDEGDHPSIDRCRRNLGRRHAAQIEQTEPEWWCQERRLQVHGQHDTEPREIHTEQRGRRNDQRHDDERDLEEVDEEPEHEDDEVHHDQEADRASGNPGERALDPQVAIEATEDERERRRTDEQEDHHDRESARLLHGSLERVQRERTVHHGQHHRTHTPSAPASVGVATPAKMLPSTTTISASGGIRETTTRFRSDQPGGTLLHRQSRRDLLVEKREDEHVRRVGTGEGEPRYESGPKQVPDAHTHLVAEHDQDDRGWDDLTERA